MLFYNCPRTSVLFILLVPVKYILVLDNRTVLSVKPCLIIQHLSFHTNTRNPKYRCHITWVDAKFYYLQV